MLGKKVKDANITYHAKMADIYDETQPYFGEDNVRRVELIIKNLADNTSGEVLLDLGAGTGFVTNIARKYFKKVYAVDITEEMLNKLRNKQYDNVEVVLADCENLPFKDNSFDACVAYSVLHHLHDITPTLKETYRVLKPNGFFFADQDPNYHFFENVGSALKEESRSKPKFLNELKTVQKVVKEVEEKYNLDEEVIRLSEYQTAAFGGIKPEKLRSDLEAAGFSDVIVTLRWYLGQGEISHKWPDKSAAIEEYLHNAEPLSRNLFKYFMLQCRKVEK